MPNVRVTATYYVPGTARYDVRPGDTVVDFRGDTAVFVAVSAMPTDCKDAKVEVMHSGGFSGWYYARVFNLTVSAE